MPPLSPTKCCSPQKSLSSQSVCDSQGAVSLQGVKASSSLCSAANSQAVSWRLWQDQMLLLYMITTSAFLPPTRTAGCAWWGSKCLCQCKCAFICVCASSHLHSCREHVKWAKNSWWAARLPSWNIVWKEKWGSLINSNFIQDDFWPRRVFLNLQTSPLYDEGFYILWWSSEHVLLQQSMQSILSSN